MKKFDDPTVKPGDTIDAMGMPVYVASDEEMEQYAENDQLMIVCMPVELNGNPVPGSTKGLCGCCKRDVWVSPATRESTPVGAPIRCLFCVKNEIDKFNTSVTNEEQVDEMKSDPLFKEEDDPWGEL